MTDKAKEIAQCLTQLADEAQARQLSRFFRTAPGQYGYGDKFLGLKVPQTRAIVRGARQEVCLADAVALTDSPWHEVRLAGFLLMVELYRQARKRRDEAEGQRLVDTYLTLIPRGNNWDLVDLICPSILGDWLIDHPEARPQLDRLAESPNLWENRVSIVSTLSLIRQGEFADTQRLAILLLDHPHDLIHKAVGWMLREMGKRDETQLLTFLDQYATRLPRTSLRYAIEKLPPLLRQYYLKLR